MSRQVDFRVTGRPGATVFRFLPLSEAARIFFDANVKLVVSQWHECSFAVEDRFARDLVDLLTEAASLCWTNSRNIDHWHAGQCTVAASPVAWHAASDISFPTDQKNDHNSVRGGSKDTHG